MIVKIQGIPINSNYIVAVEKISESSNVSNLEVQTVSKRYSFKYNSSEARNEAFNKLEKVLKDSGRFYEI